MSNTAGSAHGDRGRLLSTPSAVGIPIDTLQFVDGLPIAAVQKVYDNLDRMQGVEGWLNTVPGAYQTACTSHE